MPILLSLIPLLIPSVVKLAEKKFPVDGSGPDKKSWSEEFVLDFWDVMAGLKWVGPVMKILAPGRETVARVVGEKIEDAVSKLKAKGKL
jgi:hypothetical protein